MNLKCLVIDEKSVVGPSIPVEQGETKTFSVLWFDDDGMPFKGFTSISALVAKVFGQINQAPITKTLLASQVVLLQTADSPGGANAYFAGFRFSLTASDTGAMAANNAGLGMTFSITDSGGNITQVDVANLFNVTVPLVR